MRFGCICTCGNGFVKYVLTRSKLQMQQKEFKVLIHVYIDKYIKLVTQHEKTRLNFLNKINIASLPVKLL